MHQVDSPPGASIRFGRSRHVDLFYEVLSHLDLGKDAASLYIERPHDPVWAKTIRDAYIRELPRSGVYQFLPLRCADLKALVARLQHDQLTCARGMVQAMSELSSNHAQRWQQDARKDALRIGAICNEISPGLISLRQALWAHIGQSPWPLTVFHTKAIGRHGRGIGFEKQRAIAVSLEMPAAYALCQIFHEETHVVSDRRIVDREKRRTYPGASGYDIHQKLEKEAIALGGRVIKETLPSLWGAYKQWMESWRVHAS